MKIWGKVLTSGISVLFVRSIVGENMSPKRKDVSQGEDETPVKKGKRVELRKRLSRTASGRLNGNGSSTYGPSKFNHAFDLLLLQYL